MPYLSQRARDEIVALTDRDLLPAEGATDRDELEQCGTAAIVSCALQRDAVMYGSLSVARSTPGPWSQQLLADYRLLSAALAAGLAAQHSRALLTDALAVGDQARQVQQQFFATVGHELRTPLSTIIGYAELLADQAERQPPGEFAAEVGRDAGHVLTASEHLLDVVEDLLGTGVGVSIVEPGFIRDAGMFAASGTQLPPGVRTKAPADVAEGVARAIAEDRAEVFVAPVELRLAATFATVAPALSSRVQQRLGTREIKATGRASG